MSEIEAKISYIDKAIDDFKDKLKPISKRLASSLNKQIDKFPTKKGRFKPKTSYSKAITEAGQLLAKELKEAGYGKAVNEFLNKFDKAAALTSEVMDVEGIIVDIDEFDDLLKVFKDRGAESLANTGLTTNFIQPLQQQMTSVIMSGGSVSQLREAINAYLLGTEQTVPKLEKYAGQIANDTLRQYDGELNQQIAVAYQLDGVRYVGSLIADSRPQCVRWVGKDKIPNSDLAKEIDWANNNGSGMIPGTTEATFTIYRGGYNCRHYAIPIRMPKK